VIAHALERTGASFADLPAANSLKKMIKLMIYIALHGIKVLTYPHFPCHRFWPLVLLRRSMAVYLYFPKSLISLDSLSCRESVQCKHSQDESRT
jgi:hypothetical protein